MAGNMRATAKKLIKALGTRGIKLTFNTRQFIGVEGMPHNYFSIQQALWNEDTGKYDHKTLYSTTSMIRIVMFLRDMWYRENGWELPTDQEKWNKIRKNLEAENNG